MLASLVLVSASAVAQQAAPEPTLKAGSEVKLAPVAAAEWIQGKAPESFESGKVYIFECWATWCGPCVKAIPHMNELYKKYHAKGLEVYGMNVFEDGKDKVEKFVKAKGDGMSYPVAYTGEESAFETEWLNPAGVHGIPTAFIVRSGKLVMTTHPGRLTDAVIEALLAGGQGAEKVAAEMNAVNESSKKLNSLPQEIAEASAKGDAETMAAKIEELEKLDASSPYLPELKLALLIVKKDWPVATKTIREMPPGPGKRLVVMMAARKVAGSDDGVYPSDFTKAMLSAYAEVFDGSEGPSDPMFLAELSMLQWKNGDKKAATASANKAAKAAKAAANSQDRYSLPAAPFARFAKSVTEGTMPTSKEFGGWLVEEMEKATATESPKAAAE